MDVLVRTLLIWLLALAIPAQGLAAATMAFCGQKHHAGVVVAVAVAQPAAAAHHAHAGVEAGAMGEHHHADASAVAPDDPGLAAHAKPGSADPHKCSVCGSCCSTGALMSAVLTLPAAEAASTAFASVVATVDAFAADGPDRPPRNRPV